MWQYDFLKHEKFGNVISRFEIKTYPAPFFKPSMAFTY